MRFKKAISSYKVNFLSAPIFEKFKLESLHYVTIYENMHKSNVPIRLNFYSTARKKTKVIETDIPTILFFTKKVVYSIIELF